ncbi:MAG: sigma-70 family RNA polymerase sigma factor [Lewinella sp.]|nr:sigma-70 family RNA polymerase sigma factor [Lewinella sp.]
MSKIFAPENDQELLAGIQASQESAFAEVFRRYRVMIQGHVIKNSGSSEDAQEIIQLTMVKLFMAIREGRYEDQGKLGHYVFQLAANSWREELRRRRNRPNDSLTDFDYQLADDSEEQIALAVVKDKQLQALHQALGQMGQPCQDLIKKLSLKKEQLKSIAVQLDYDYNNLRKRLFDCRKKLKQLTESLLTSNR